MLKLQFLIDHLYNFLYQYRQLRWDNAFDDFDPNELDFVVSPQIPPAYDDIEVSEDAVMSENTYNLSNQK